MKIAYYSHYFTPEIGAPPARIHEFAREWLAQGQEVEVVTCFPNHPIGRLYPGYSVGLYMHERLDGIDVYRHWTFITPNQGFVRKTIGHLSYLPSALLLSNRRIPKPDIVIGTSPTFFAASAAASLARRHQIPFVMEIRDLWPAVFVELGVLRNRLLIGLLEKWELSMYRRATRIVAVTESFRTNLLERGIAPGKVVTVLNGADLEFWRPSSPPDELRRRLNLEGCFVVLYLGAHGISQALKRILDSAGRLKGKPHIRFLFVGEGAEKDSLMRQAQDSGLWNVHFLDAVDKTGARELYALADVCLVPLRDIRIFDTFIPSKMFEIMAMGRPIVASLRGEAADILQRSGAAIVVAPEDSSGIAQAIEILAGDPAQAGIMGRQGRDFVATHYSRRSLALRYLQVLEEAAEAFRGGSL